MSSCAGRLNEAVDAYAAIRDPVVYLVELPYEPYLREYLAHDPQRTKLLDDSASIAACQILWVKKPWKNPGRLPGRCLREVDVMSYGRLVGTRWHPRQRFQN